MDLLNVVGGATTNLLGYIVPFLFVLTVVVFIHELGHFLVGRWCGVGVTSFSIGFGPELVGWTDRNGTRWKVSAIPLGGYVKFLGDSDATSATASDKPLSSADRRRAFFSQPFGAGALQLQAGDLVAAGGLGGEQGQRGQLVPALACQCRRRDAAWHRRLQEPTQRRVVRLREEQVRQVVDRHHARGTPARGERKVRGIHDVRTTRIRVGRERHAEPLPRHRHPPLRQGEPQRSDVSRPALRQGQGLQPTIPMKRPSVVGTGELARLPLVLHHQARAPVAAAVFSTASLLTKP